MRQNSARPVDEIIQNPNIEEEIKSNSERNVDQAFDVELSNLNQNVAIDNRTENVRDIPNDKPREPIPAIPSYAAPITRLEPQLRNDLINSNNNNNDIFNNNIDLQRNLSIVLPSVDPEQKIGPSRTFRLDCCQMSRGLLGFCHIILFFFVITILVLTTISRSIIEFSEYYYLKKIADNWKLSPYSSMRKCEGYPVNESNILEGNQWMGLVKGCNCRSTVKRTDSCNPKNGCYQVYPRPRQDYTYWRNTKICADKFQETYFDFNIEENAASCPSGTRSCGIIDTENNHLCMDNNEECPINSVKIMPNNNGEGNRINLGNNDLLFGNPDANSNPIGINSLTIPIEFKLSEGVPCKNPYFNNIPHSLYILDYWLDRQYCYAFIEDDKDEEINWSYDGYKSYILPQSNLLYYDESYIKIDSYSQNEFFKENNIYKLLVNLPSFQREKTEGDMHLSYKPYFGLKMKCLKRIKNQGLKNGVYVDFEVIENHLNGIGILTVSFVFLIITIFTYCFYNIGGLCSKNDQKIYDLRFCASVCCYIPLGLGYFIPIIVVASGSRDKNILDSIFKDTNCVDDYTAQIYDKFVTKNQDVRQMLVVNIILGVLLLLGEIVTSCIIYVNKNN